MHYKMDYRLSAHVLKISAVLLFLHGISSVGCQDNSDFYSRDSAVDNYDCLTSDMVVTSTNSKSLADCARLCSSTDNCTSFFYTEMTSVCHGCREMYTASQLVASTSNGSVYFTTGQSVSAIQTTTAPGTGISGTGISGTTTTPGTGIPGTGISVTTTTSTPTNVSYQYTFGSSGYNITSTSQEWEEGVEECMKIGALPIAIETQTENDFIKQQLGILGSSSVWIGLSQPDDSYWAWNATNETLQDIGFDNWRFTEPDDDGPCALMFNYFTYEWADYDCGLNFAMICEFDLS